MNLQTAQAAAGMFLGLIYASCEEVMICGSVRRQKPDDIHDIEIVTRPRVYKEIVGLFGEAQTSSELNAKIAALLHQGVVSLHVDARGATCNGEKHKKLMYRGAMIDLYTAETGNWGNIVAIRTGNADFSRLLVTKRNAGGFMPSHLRQQDGYLWNGDERIDCLTEQAFFAALGLEWVEPEHRNKITADALLRKTKMSASAAIAGMVTP